MKTALWYTFRNGSAFRAAVGDFRHPEHAGSHRARFVSLERLNVRSTHLELKIDMLREELDRVLVAAGEYQSPFAVVF